MKPWVRELKLQRMEDFEEDARKSGATTGVDTSRDPADDTKWASVHMDRLFSLWLAGARYGKEMNDGTDERPSKVAVPL